MVFISIMLFLIQKNEEIKLVNLDIDEETLSIEHNQFLETFADLKNTEQKPIYPILNEKLRKLFDKLDDISKVYISLDGTLNSINFNLLKNATNDYFADIYDIRYLTNLKYLSNEKKIHNRTASLYGISEFVLDKNKLKEGDNFAFRNIANVDSTFRSFRFSNLPNAVSEVQIIEEILQNNNYEVEKYIESEATEYNVKDLKGAGILHLVTHGKYIDDTEAKIYKDVKGSSKYLDNALLRSFLVLNQDKNKNEK
jgi:CHAT domain-containing protein